MNGNSSDSSDDSYDPNAILFLPPVRQMLLGNAIVPRAPKIWYHRMDWNQHVAILQQNGKFRGRYRMSYNTFEKLCGILDLPLDEHQSLRSTSGNQPIQKEMIVGCGLRYLAGDSTSSLSDLFGMADTSTKTTVSKFLEAVLTSDHDDLRIEAPTGERLRRTADGFALISTAPSSLFEGCCGAIDGWVVQITKPKDSEVENVADYHSGHYCCYGLVVLAMCDSQLCFTYSAVAGTGRTNDARAFARLEALQQWLSDLPAPYFIVGDNAFPLTNKMLVPFPGRLRQLLPVSAPDPDRDGFRPDDDQVEDLPEATRYCASKIKRHHHGLHEAAQLCDPE
jgi:DDE superfamily endonuclease